MKNILGVDHGTKRIGLAIARGGLKIAYPLTTIANNEYSLQALQAVVDEEQVGQLVIGLPRSLAGNDTEQTVLARTFAEELKSLGLPVALHDEAATTVAAVEKGATKANKDAWAAALILQSYLEERE